MVRTIITLDAEDKTWLDRRAREESTTMAELVRRAVRQYRRETETTVVDFDTLLEKTRGLWTKGDGLIWQRRMRSEWRER